MMRIFTKKERRIYKKQITKYRRIEAEDFNLETLNTELTNIILTVTKEMTHNKTNETVPKKRKQRQQNRILTE